MQDFHKTTIVKRISMEFIVVAARMPLKTITLFIVHKVLFPIQQWLNL